MARIKLIAEKKNLSSVSWNFNSGKIIIIVDKNVFIVDKNIFVVDKNVFVVDENDFTHDDFELERI